MKKNIQPEYPVKFYRSIHLPITILVGILLPFLIARADFVGKVVAVIDGDTIDVLKDNKPVRIRLHGVDCPEKGQAFGAKAKQETSSMAFGKQVKVVEKDTDTKYKRVVGDVTVIWDGKNLSQELVKSGLAWWYKQYALDDKAMAELEAKAKAEKKGLWSSFDPIRPQDYRYASSDSSARPVASAPASVQSASENKPNGESTAKGQTIYEGPRGGRYHYSGSGKKVYERINK